MCEDKILRIISDHKYNHLQQIIKLFLLHINNILSNLYSLEINKLGMFFILKVLDELFSVLRVIEVSKDPPACSALLQEFRDISSMAMEHFEEVVVPRLKKLSQRLNPGLLLSPFVQFRNGGSKLTGTYVNRYLAKYL